MDRIDFGQFPMVWVKEKLCNNIITYFSNVPFCLLRAPKNFWTSSDSRTALGRAKSSCNYADELNAKLKDQCSIRL